MTKERGTGQLIHIDFKNKKRHETPAVDEPGTAVADSSVEPLDRGDTPVSGSMTEEESRAVIKAELERLKRFEITPDILDQIKNVIRRTRGVRTTETYRTTILRIQGDKSDEAIERWVTIINGNADKINTNPSYFVALYDFVNHIKPQY